MTTAILVAAKYTMAFTHFLHVGKCFGTDFLHAQHPLREGAFLPVASEACASTSARVFKYQFAWGPLKEKKRKRKV